MPRPAFALGTIALFVSATFDPLWFAEWMQGLALVPEQVWWLLGAIVSFYFGARELHKIRSGGMAQEAAQILLQWPLVASRSSGCSTSATPLVAADHTPETRLEISEAASNQAAEDWRATSGYPLTIIKKWKKRR